jgi:hypothetical protein
VVKVTEPKIAREISHTDELHKSPDLDAVERVVFSILFAGVRDDYRLEDLPNLGARAHNALRRHDAITFSDINSWTVESLSQRWNVGSTTVNEIIAALGTISRIGESDLVANAPELPRDADPENISAREALHAWW